GFDGRRERKPEKPRAHWPRDLATAAAGGPERRRSRSRPGEIPLDPRILVPSYTAFLQLFGSSYPAADFRQAPWNESKLRDGQCPIVPGRATYAHLQANPIPGQI